APSATAATHGSPAAPGAGGSSPRVASGTSPVRGTSVAPGSRPASGAAALPPSARCDGGWLIVSSATSRLLRDNAARGQRQYGAAEAPSPSCTRTVTRPYPAGVVPVASGCGHFDPGRDRQVFCEVVARSGVGFAELRERRAGRTARGI